MKKNVCKKILNDNCFITKTDIDGNITYVNDNYCKISRYSRDELIGNSYSKIKSNETNDSTYKNMWDTILSGEIWNGILKNKTKDNRVFLMDTTIYPIFDKQNNIKEFVSYGDDLTHYSDLIQYDQLTGLKKRESLKKEMDNLKDYVCVIINLDNFTDVIEFYGGIVADKVIVETAKRLVKVFKDCGIYRLQRDEFAVLRLLPNQYDKNEFENIMKNKLLSIFEEPFTIDDSDIFLAATSGISVGSIDNLRNANLAFKDAKSKNKTYSIYTDDLLIQIEKYEKNKRIASEIKDAIKSDDIVPYFQPIIDNNSGGVAKYEALARLIKANDVVPPGAFIDISKKIKYYHQITRSILEKSFESFGDKKDVGVSINLTIEDISNIRTFNLIVELLNNNSHNENITFELVESDGIEDHDLFNKFVSTIKGFGAKISIDDFGTGYSNFTYLAQIEPDFLKIDGSLIKNIENVKDYDVVKTIVDFAKMYNIKTVAEFVENEDIFILVKELGIDYSQGYYFSKPLALADIEDDLAKEAKKRLS